MIETYLIQALIILFALVFSIRIWFEIRNMLNNAREDWKMVTPIEELDKVPTRLPYEPNEEIEDNDSKESAELEETVNDSN